ncbi:MFS-type transporter SLC18B1-like [Ornithodoros turicata]|uniref:MFS-type transporter SLC18B1-like n=1 Tax=Ornithodoros turicata TaxID=34597 RepID=UPI003139B98A
MVAGGTPYCSEEYERSYREVEIPFCEALAVANETEGLCSESTNFKTENGAESELLKKDAGKKEGVTNRQRIILVTLAFGHFCVGASISLQAPFFPHEAERKGATPTQYGFVFSVFELTIFFVAPLFGKIVALVRPKFMLMTGLFWVGAASILFGSLIACPAGKPFLYLAIAIRVVEGLGTAAFQTAVFTIVAAEFPTSVATVYSIQQTVFGTGLVAGPTIGGALYQLAGFALPFVVIGALMLISAIIIYYLLPPPEELIDCSNKTGQLLKFWCNIGVLLNAYAIFTTFLIIGFNSAVLEPHLRQFNLQPVVLGLIFVLNGSVYASTAWIWGRLADKTVWTDQLTVAGCVLLAISLLLFGPAPFINSDTKIWMVMLGLAVFGSGSGGAIVCPFVGSLRDTLARGFPDDLSTYGLVSSLFTSSHSMGAFVGPTLGGYLFESLGYRWGSMLFFMNVIVLIIAYCVFMLVKRCSQKARAPLLKGVQWRRQL